MYICYDPFTELWSVANEDNITISTHSSREEAEDEIDLLLLDEVMEEDLLWGKD